MNKEDLLKQMKDSVGNKEPVEFFRQMVDAFDLMFDQVETLQKQLQQVKTNSALAIQWEPKVASEMLSRQIEVLRKDKETYHNELSALKEAYTRDVVTLNYNTFCQFWTDTLGWHPFLDYK